MTGREPHPRSWRARLLAGIAWLGLLAVVAPTLLVWSARWFWLGEIAASFAWYLGWGSLLGALLLAVLRRPRLAAVVLCLAAGHLWTEARLWIPHERAGPLATPAAPTFSIASCNLLWTNEDHEGFLGWLDAADPDVVACLEVSERWRLLFAGLRDRYPHQLYAPGGPWDETTWGTVFLSRLPFTATRLIPIEGVDERPAMEAELRLAGRPVRLRGAHPLRPGRSWRIEMRNAVLRTLGRQGWGARDILLGDLNVTASSPAFADLLAASGLRDSRRGFGRLPSYRTRSVVPGLEIAIDHILVGDAFHVLERRTDPLPGSDHRIAFARLALRHGPSPRRVQGTSR